MTSLERLRGAIDAARVGSCGALRTLVTEASTERPASSALAIVLARAAVVVREHDLALSLLADPPEDRDFEAAVEWRVGLAARIGRTHAALALADEAALRRPNTRRHESAARLRRMFYDREGALRHLRAAASTWASREIERLTSEGVADLASPRPLWRGDYRLEHATSSKERGAARLFSGDAEGALRELEVDLDAADEETHVLRAEAYAALGRGADAEAALQRAGRDLDGFAEYLAALAVRALVRGERLASLMGEEGTAAAARALVEAAGRGGDPTDPKVVLGALNGNRSTTPTTVRPDGRLHAVTVAPSSRTLARWAQRRIEHAPVADVLEGFGHVFARYPESSLPFCYRGEIHLWCGDLSAAEADFQRAIAIHGNTFWAWVGVGAVQLLRGEPARTLETYETIVRATGRVGPTLFVYRGEARRLSGDLDGAVADLERSRSDREGRIGTWVNLGLARATRGEHDETRAIVGHLRSAAHAFLADAARAIGRDPAISAEAPIDDLVAVLEQMLQMARGNRSSSCLTYFTPEGELRFVPRGALDDDAELEALALVVDRMLGRAPARRSGPAR